MSGFDFTGDYPSPVEDQIVDEQKPEGYDALVDRLMFVMGLDRDEAEIRAMQILEDDAA